MKQDVDLSVQIASGLKLRNPVLTASGTFGYGDEYCELIDIQQLGAIICKGTTLRPREGNPQPRVFEVTSGVLNSVGLQNMGVEALIKDKAPLWATWRVPVIVNVAGDTISEYVQVAAKLEGVAGISGIEVNISCPNVKAGGMQFGTDPQVAAEVTAAVKAATSLPVIVKLSPNVTDIAAIAKAVEKAGADAISLINTISAMYIDFDRTWKSLQQKQGIWKFTGGLSGPAIKHIALNMVYKVTAEVGIPVIGCGGIMDAKDAMEFIAAGATAIQVGTATLQNPDAALEIKAGIEKILSDHDIKSLSGFQQTLRSSRSC